MNVTSSSPPTGDAAAALELERSSRLPLLVLFISGAVWLVIGSVFGVIATLKFHMPSFLADCPWLTYGRVRPAYFNSMLYGFCLQAGLGMLLWIFVRLGRTLLVQPGLVMVGAMLWNLGVTIGIIGVLAGDGSGHENLDMPQYAALVLFLGYLTIGVWAAMTFHRRAELRLVPSQWFLLTALFWFPWIYSTANLLVLTFPARGVAQAVIAWWYSGNLYVVWFGLIGLAIIFYFVPLLTGRALKSYYLSLFTFWSLILAGSWVGIPNSAPAPAWIPALSTVGTVFLIVPVITVVMNIYGCFRGLTGPRGEPLRFVTFGTVSFLVAALLYVIGALAKVTDLTWFPYANAHLQFYGFLSMTLFGAIYYVLPRVMGLEFPYPSLVRMHFRLAAGGILLIVLPLAIAGVVQGLRLQTKADFNDIIKGGLMFLRISTLGDLLLLAGHVMFLSNVIGLARRYYQARAKAAYAAVTTEIKPAGAAT